jgi:hypothetical protein
MWHSLIELFGIKVRTVEIGNPGSTMKISWNTITICQRMYGSPLKYYLTCFCFGIFLKRTLFQKVRDGHWSYFTNCALMVASALLHDFIRKVISAFHFFLQGPENPYILGLEMHISTYGTANNHQWLGQKPSKILNNTSRFISLLQMNA